MFWRCSCVKSYARETPLDVRKILAHLLPEAIMIFWYRKEHISSDRIISLRPEKWCGWVLYRRY
jgi:hypothetical protein